MALREIIVFVEKERWGECCEDSTAVCISAAVEFVRIVGLL